MEVNNPPKQSNETKNPIPKKFNLPITFARRDYSRRRLSERCLFGNRSSRRRQWPPNSHADATSDCYAHTNARSNSYTDAYSDAYSDSFAHTGW
jgi:hypothetical protein